MCVIYFSRDHKSRPPLSELRRGEEINGDGGGIAYYDNKGVPCWRKGLKSEEIDEFLQHGAPGGKPVAGAMFIHFRIASIGDPIPELTHPFPIDGKASTALTGQAPNGLLLQNGTWSGWKDKGLMRAVEFSAGKIRIPDSGPWNDARALAFLAHHYGVTWLDFADHNSKIAVMLRNEAYVIGDWLKGTGGDWIQSSSTFRASNYQGGHRKRGKGAGDEASGVPSSPNSKSEPKTPLALPPPSGPGSDPSRRAVALPELIKLYPTPAKVDPEKHYTDGEMADAIAVLRGEEVPLLGLTEGN